MPGDTRPSIDQAAEMLLLTLQKPNRFTAPLHAFMNQGGTHLPYQCKNVAHGGQELFSSDISQVSGEQGQLNQTDHCAVRFDDGLKEIREFFRCHSRPVTS